jgi:hypothetical protein
VAIPICLFAGWNTSSESPDRDEDEWAFFGELGALHRALLWLLTFICSSFFFSSS